MHHDRGPQTTGRVLHAAAAYDVLASLLLFGRGDRFRERILQLARIGAGQSALDVGCGTGSLAIAAKRHAGMRAHVEGVDASPEMIARATKKARKAGVDVTFSTAVAESLPFPDGRFDIVLTTLVLHHLPAEPREQCVREIFRVLKSGGRVLVVEFARGKGILHHMHHGRHVAIDDVKTLLTRAGLELLESGPVGMLRLQFVLAAKR